MNSMKMKKLARVPCYKLLLPLVATYVATWTLLFHVSLSWTRVVQFLPMYLYM